ncbi:MAG: hypothetical protein ABIO70_32035 [Pseudomonadota bacterium]
MKPLFAVQGTRPLLPLFVSGELLQGRPLGWILAGGVVRPAQVRARLWRLPSGAVVVEPSSEAGWLLGELHSGVRPEQLTLLLDLVCGDPDVKLELLRARARVEARAVTVLVPGAEGKALAAAGGVALRTGDWGRVAPG